MSHDDQLKDPLYRNWVKAGLGIKYLHEGIVNYIDTQVKTLQANFLTDIRNNLGNPSAKCSSCKLENVLPCPTPGLCTIRSGKPCRFHRLHRYTPCPNKCCDKVYEKIKTIHRDEKPSWKNTDPTKWCTDHWEIGKCFMAETGYYDKQSAVDTDCTGLLSVIVNCLYMAKKFDVYLDPPNDIVCKNRKARNEIFHSASMKLTDAERDRYIDDMVLLLKDKKLTTELNVQSAITKLHQLKVRTLAISVREEYDIRLEALHLVETLKQEAITAIRERQDECTEAVVIGTQTALETIDGKKEETKKAHEVHTKDINEMYNRLSEHGERIEQSLDAKVASIKQVLDICQFDVNAILKDVHELKEQHLKKIDDLTLYMQNKKDLQTKLYNMYDKHLSSVPLSPLLDDIDAHINDIFVELVLCNDAVHEPKKIRDNITDRSEPERKRAKLDTQAEHIGMDISSLTGKETIVYSYEDILFKDGEKCENVYIVGDAGMGKTTWCMRMLNTWVNVMNSKLSGDKSSENQATYDKTMSRFDCVFFVSLRHASNDSDLLQMINHQLLLEYPKLLCITKTVLETEPEKCLVIVDGLDEWIPPEDNVSQSTLRSSDLPTRSNLHGCTVVTTTRPWKLERIRLKDHEINRAVNIKGINDKNILIDKIICCLKQKQETENDDESAKCSTDAKDSKEFIKVANVSSMSSCMDIPLVLVFLVCLWYDKGSLASSMVGNFSALIDFLLQISLGNSSYNKKSKLSGVKNLNDYISECEYTNPLLHSCLGNKMYCRRFHLLLSKLAKLAFTSLFRQSKESTLVFTQDSLEHVFNAIEIDIAVKVGILSQSKVIGNTLSRSSSLSFLHKTIQEFLSAIHIVRSGKDCLETTYKQYCCNIDTVYEMTNVLVFVSGMSFEIAYEMSRHIAMILKSDKSDEYHRTLLSNQMTLMLFECLNELQEITSPPLCCLYTERVIVLEDDIYRKEHLVNLVKTNSPHLTHFHVDLPEDVELPEDSKMIDTNELIYMEQIYKSLQDTNNLVMLVLSNVYINATSLTNLVNALQSKSTCRIRYLKLDYIDKITRSTQEQINIDMQYLTEMDMFALENLTAWTFRLPNAILTNVAIAFCTDCKVYIGSLVDLNRERLVRCVKDCAGKTIQLSSVDCFHNIACDINIVNSQSSLVYRDEGNIECRVSIESKIHSLKLLECKDSTLDIKMRCDSSEVTDDVLGIKCDDICNCTIHVDTHVENTNFYKCFHEVSFNCMLDTSVEMACGILNTFELLHSQSSDVLLKTPVQMFPPSVTVNNCYKGSLVIQVNECDDENVQEPSCVKIKGINCKDIVMFNMIIGNNDNNAERIATCQDVQNEINTPNEPESARLNVDRFGIHSIEPCCNNSNENVVVERKKVGSEYIKNDTDNQEVFDIDELTWTHALCCSIQVNVSACISHLILKDVFTGHVDLLNSRVSRLTIDDISEASLSHLENKCDLNNITYLSIPVSDLHTRLEYILDELSGEMTPSKIFLEIAIKLEFKNHSLLEFECSHEGFNDYKKRIFEIRSLHSKYISGNCMVPLLKRLSSCTGLKHLDFQFQTNSKRSLELVEQNIGGLTRLEELELCGSLSVNDFFDSEHEDGAVLFPPQESLCSTDSDEAIPSVISSTVDHATWFTHNSNLCSLSLNGNGIPSVISNSFKNIASLKYLTCSDNNKDFRVAFNSNISELLQLERLTVDFIPSLPTSAHFKQLQIDKTIINYPEFYRFIDAWRASDGDFEVTIRNAKVDCETDILINKICGVNSIASVFKYDADMRRHVIDCIAIKTSASVKQMVLPFNTSIDQFDLDNFHSGCHIFPKRLTF